MAEVTLAQPVHAMTVQPRMHRIGHQHGVVEGRDADAVTGEDLPVVFHVLADLEDRVILEHRLQQRQRLGQRHLPFGRRVRGEQIAAARP